MTHGSTFAVSVRRTVAGRRWADSRDRAHTLEHLAWQAAYPGKGWHHARLCATLLLPVMQFNCDTSDKWNCLSKTWPLDRAAIFAVLRQLFEPKTYATILPPAESH